ncbi:MAG TPA: hypothetical protein VKA44_09240 [Gemmatimonadota bacterium]|nr:hypothetical protein [Gemmatimonadota bacterium]
MSANQLAALDVLDRLEVGPVRLEPRRITAAYTVQRGSRRDSTELVYRFEDDVFDPESPADRNLATLAAAQLALNYGLFADRIVLHGPLDPADRGFLADMAENTAREIYVKKFLEPNPFLVGAAAELPAVRRERYCRARLVFPEGTGEPAPTGGWTAPAAGSGHAVLSSGGKDSLLTQGLLEEAGHEPLAVFVNESGRHWYTAMGAHRHLAATRPERTARVWTTSDRVFAWMLGHLPMVRGDFARLRSDEYPIRLWTVAVFLFGALPVLRRRGRGRLLIGDEYDTSRRASRAGIPHCDGLYDQSIWFDAALTRFYRRKGWPLEQLSLLRPLSEILIQGLLAERYPELHALQVSCHAAHIDEEGRVRPCGRCEKCRRIVGMHLAMGADPGACGYDEEAVEACLRALRSEPVHQEAAGSRHMLWLLSRRGLLEPGADARAEERPEVVRLRFHPELSPVEAIPTELREPAFRAWLEVAEGALERVGREWRPVDALDGAILSRPYRYAAREPTPEREEAG